MEASEPGHMTGRRLPESGGLSLLIAAAGVAASLALFFYARSENDRYQHNHVAEASRHAMAVLQHRLDTLVGSVQVIDAFFGASQTVEDIGFSRFIKSLPRQQDMDLVLWAPREGDLYPVRFIVTSPDTVLATGISLNRDLGLRDLIDLAPAGRPMPVRLDAHRLGLAPGILVGVMIRRALPNAPEGVILALGRAERLFHVDAALWPTLNSPQLLVTDEAGRPLIGQETANRLHQDDRTGPLVLPARLRLDGLPLQVLVQAQPTSESPLGLLPPMVLPSAGLLFTAAIVAFLHRTRRNARAIAQLARSLGETNIELSRRIEERDIIAEALSDSERKYRGIVENAIAGILRTAPDGHILDANPAAVRIFGCDDAADLIATYPDLNRDFYVDPERRAAFLQHAEGAGALRGFDSQARRKDGQIIWISETARTVRDATGRTLYYEGTVQDITEHKTAEATLRLAKEQADMLSRAKSEFLTNVSHELRTPLNAIIGFSEMLKNELFGPIGCPEYVEFARDIHDGGNLLLELIDDILDMSRVESGKKELNESLVDIARVAQTCMRLIRERAGEVRIALIADLPSNLPPVRGEERSIKQIINNLLSNAVKFTPEGGTVTLAARLEEDGRLLIRVSDTGIGIAPEDMAKAMAPFGQISSSLAGKSDGTGLGLPLIKSLAELHGGTLVLKSTVGIGTTAEVWLPAERVVCVVA